MTPMTWHTLDTLLPVAEVKPVRSIELSLGHGDQDHFVHQHSQACLAVIGTQYLRNARFKLEVRFWLISCVRHRVGWDC